jgi:hypothetical protein
MAEWREVQAEDNGKYAFVEQLPGDAPMTLLAPFWECNKIQWRYWTTAGWAADQINAKSVAKVTQ